MTTQSDLALVQAAIRLGWSVSEIRGRYRGQFKDEYASRPAFPGKGHALPLQSERGLRERAIEVEASIRALADTLAVDFPACELSWQPKDAAGVASDVLRKSTRNLARAVTSDVTWKIEWSKFSRLLFSWDAKIQDRLYARSLSLSAGYQLGRGLAEASWALDPSMTNPDDPTSWQFLLGVKRVTALTTFLERLSIYFDELTIQGIRTSLMAWSLVTSDPLFTAAHDPVVATDF